MKKLEDMAETEETVEETADVASATIAVCGSSSCSSSVADAATDAVLLAVMDVDAATTAACGSSSYSSSAADAAIALATTVDADANKLIPAQSVITICR